MYVYLGGYVQGVWFKDLRRAHVLGGILRGHVRGTCFRDLRRAVCFGGYVLRAYSRGILWAYPIGHV